MKFLSRLTVLDVVLLVAFVVVGIVWVGQRLTPAEIAPPAVPEAAMAPVDPLTVGEATDQAVRAILSENGEAYVEALLAVAAAATRGGNAEAAIAVRAYADAFAYGDDATYLAAGRRLDAMSADPIVGPLTVRITAAFMTPLLDFPAEAAPAGAEWAQILIVPAVLIDEPLAAVRGTVSWTRETGPDGPVVVGRVDLADAALSGTVRLTRAGTPEHTVAVAASFAGSLTETAIGTFERLTVGDGTFAFDETLDADLAVTGPWQISAGLRSAATQNAPFLRGAWTVGWSGQLENGDVFVIQLMLGDGGRAAIAGALPAWGL